MKQGIGILGGTFDPIHLGHLQIADSLTKACHLKEIKFIPCKMPVHKQLAQATTEQRLMMLQLALEDKSHYTIDLREINRETPSYMIETLQSLRQEFPHTPFVLIIGLDSFLNLEQWKDWQHLLDYAHIAVATRPNFSFAWPINLEREFKSKCMTDPQQLLFNLKGNIYFHDTNSLDISSSAVRESIAKNKDIKGYVPEQVANYILTKRPY